MAECSYEDGFQRIHREFAYSESLQTAVPAEVVKVGDIKRISLGGLVYIERIWGRGFRRNGSMQAARDVSFCEVDCC